MYLREPFLKRTVDTATKHEKPSDDLQCARVHDARVPGEFLADPNVLSIDTIDSITTLRS